MKEMLSDNKVSNEKFSMEMYTKKCMQEQEKEYFIWDAEKHNKNEIMNMKVKIGGNYEKKNNL